MYKKTLAAAVTSVIFMASLAGCTGGRVNYIASEDKFVNNAAALSIKTGIKDDGYMDFVFDSMGKCCEKNDGQNVMISPASILFAMSMIESGASGNTLDEMGSVLVPGATGSEAIGFAASYYSFLSKLSDDNLKIANGVFINDDSKVQLYQKYIDYVSETFDAQVDEKPFNNSTLKEINKWVDEKTDGMIPGVLSSLDPDDIAVLINTITFEGAWAKQYSENSILPDETFTTSDGNEQKVTMLDGYEGKYYETDKAIAFGKSYAYNGYMFLAVLPKDESISANEFMADFSAADYEELMSNPDIARVYTRIPEFSSDYSNEDFAGVLKSLGMNDVFTSDADLSNMCDGDLFISKIIHKTHIEVDREGTKASAVTTGCLSASASMPPEEEVYIYLNRPFAYMIIDTQSGTPVFIGTVNSVN